MIYVMSAGGGSKSTVYISGLTQADTSSVVATSAGKTVSGSYKDGYWVLKNLDYGTAASPVTWDITAIAANGQQTATAQVSFPRQEIEYITMSYFTATIAVTYPAGSTCTCTKGDTVLTAPDTSGSYTFTVPEAGDWIVKAVQGDDSAVETVSITSNGQAETVELTFWDYLINGSDVGISGGWELTMFEDGGDGAPHANISINASGLICDAESGLGYNLQAIYASKDKVRFDKYSTLTIDTTSLVHTPIDGTTRIVLSALRDANNNSPAGVKIMQGNTALDLSNVNGDYYVLLTMDTTATPGQYRSYAQKAVVECMTLK